ncbi:MAG TPA: tetratricopeptide repeat protein [Terracidiphilus sp.]|nr:tetratricopeptide repeat protein [Terracidiphilus sp.]
MKALGYTSIFLVVSISPVLAQQNGAPLPLPAPSPASAANTDAASDLVKKEVVNVNAALVAARKATAEKRFADSEALMEKVTASDPNLVPPWVELGLAQLGLKKYDSAEKSFKLALGIDSRTQALKHDSDFYQKPDAPGVVAPGATRASRNAVGGIAIVNGQTRTPDILGTSYASLGEVYIHDRKFDDAKAAFDTAVTDYPMQAAQYRRNETILFFQAGDVDAQFDSASQAIALDPTRAILYYFKGQALVSKATVDSKTGKISLPPGCAEAYQKYLELDPKGEFSADATGVLTAAGIPPKKK